MCSRWLSWSIRISLGGVLLGALAPAWAQGDEPAASGGLLAQAREAYRGGHRIEALALCEQRLAQRPDDVEALTLRVRLLGELGGSSRALQLAQQQPGEVGQQELARLENDVAAHELRWSQAEPADPRRPYAEADRALSDLDGLIAKYDHSQPAVAANAKVDRLIAQDNAGRGREAAKSYQAMIAKGQTLPAYAEAAAADAELSAHRPEQAVKLYESAIKHNPPPYAPGDPDPRSGLMYAYLESGRPRDAIALADRTAKSEPVWIAKPNTPRPDGNPHKTEADLNAVLVREYTWQLDDAAQRLKALRDQAPANEVLWREWGNLQRARGNPRAAQDALMTAYGLDPSDPAIRLGMIDSWRELYDYALVEPALQQVEAVRARDNQVQQLRRSWERQQGWQFDLSYTRGQGNSPNYGDSDHETQATVASPLLDDHWRIYGTTRLAGASLPEGQVTRERVGAGVRTYWYGVQAYLQVLPAVGPDTRRTAVESGVQWAASDHWDVAADWSNTGDADTPLRANYYGTTAHSIDAAVRWHQNDTTSARLSASQDRFTDGNLRHSVQGEVVQRLVTAPYLNFDGGVQIGQLTDSRTDVPYYSPDRARWVMLTGRLKNLLHQRYERDWRQQIDFSVGSINEQHYGSGWAANLRYGQTFQPKAGWALGWGLSWGSQRYDGKRDSRVALDITLHEGE